MLESAVFFLGYFGKNLYVLCLHLRMPMQYLCNSVLNVFHHFKSTHL